METLCLKNYEICSKLTVKTPERRYRLRSMSLLLGLTIFTSFLLKKSLMENFIVLNKIELQELLTIFD